MYLEEERRPMVRFTSSAPMRVTRPRASMRKGEKARRLWRGSAGIAVEHIIS